MMNAKERKIIIQGNKIALGVSETLVRTARGKSHGEGDF